MATNRGTINYAYRGTASTTADQVFLARSPNSITIQNAGSSDVYVSTNLQGTADPVIKTDGAYLVPAAGARTIAFTNSVAWVKIISASTPEYQLEAVY